MVTISSISPFVEQRRERGRFNASVFINYEDYPKWASVNNYLITGSRGTGKSSILASFDYRLRWMNSKAISYCDEYKDLMPFDIRDTNIIGVLFKADRVEAVMWDKWYQNESGNGSLLFSTYLNFYFAGKILESVKTLMELYYPESIHSLSKSALIDRLFRLCDPGWNRRYALLYDFSTEGIVTFLEERKTQIRQTIYTGTSMSMLAGSCFHSASSAFISEFCEILCSEIKELSRKLFFLMIDDVDRFKDWQVRCINSFLKVSTSPCAWKLSSSLPYQTLATEDDARISGTDLKISVLNDESVLGKRQQKDRIDELYNAIFMSRLKENGISHSGFTDVRALFGKMDLERSLKDVIDQSLKPMLKNDYSDYKKSGDKYFTDYWLKKKGILRKTDSRKKFDKYRVNATFSIVKANDLEESFKYSSYEVIRSLCAGSPRHFLRICDSMWPSIAKKLKSSSRVFHPIDKNEQNRAIRKASNELVEIIDRDRFNRDIPTSCKTMCDRLGDLFILLTNDDISLRRSQECMSVLFDVSEIEDSEKRNNLLKIIDKLTMLEVIKVRTGIETPSIYQLGLNPMLSPCYFISFRNPFLNKVSVNAERFYEYLTGNNEEADPRVLAHERLDYFGPSLFDEITDE